MWKMPIAKKGSTVQRQERDEKRVSFQGADQQFNFGLWKDKYCMFINFLRRKKLAHTDLVVSECRWHIALAWVQAPWRWGREARPRTRWPAPWSGPGRHPGCHPGWRCRWQNPSDHSCWWWRQRRTSCRHQGSCTPTLLDQICGYWGWPQFTRKVRSYLGKLRVTWRVH